MTTISLCYGLGDLLVTRRYVDGKAHILAVRRLATDYRTVASRITNKRWQRIDSGASSVVFILRKGVQP